MDTYTPVITMAELPLGDQELLMQFLVKKRIQFFKDSDGSYVANVRMHDEDSAKEAGISDEPDDLEQTGRSVASRKEQSAPSSASRGKGRSSSRGASIGPDDMLRSVTYQGRALFDTTSYSAFVDLISSKDTARKPKRRPLSWLMRIIEDLYNTRYKRDTSSMFDEDGEGKEAGTNPDDQLSQRFPIFVVQQQLKVFGLKSLVDSTCWDILYTMHEGRREHVECELFARFLEEYYDPDDLLYFLYVRSVIEKELKIDFRSRWSEIGRGGASRTGTPHPVYLNQQECRTVARVVFGSESDPLCRKFLRVVDEDLAGSRRIEVMRYLQLAVDDYHESRPADGEEDGGAAEGAGGGGEPVQMGQDEQDRLVRDAERQYEQRQRERERNGQGNDGAAAAPSAEPPAAAPADSGAGPGGDSGDYPTVSRELLERLSVALHESNQTYLGGLMRQAEGLPKDARDNIKIELEKALNNVVDLQLQNCIGDVEAGGSIDKDAKPLSAAFREVIDSQHDADSNQAAISSFCRLLAASKAVRGSLEPMAQMMVTFVTSKQAGAAAGGADAAGSS